MAEILDEERARQNVNARILDANLHPVTRVYCNGDGIIMLERHNADPVPVSPGTPKSSRTEALRIGYATMRAVRRQMEQASTDLDKMVAFRRPISQSGIGLTYEEYEKQLVAAAKQSREAEARLADEAARRHGLGI